MYTALFTEAVFRLTLEHHLNSNRTSNRTNEIEVIIHESEISKTGKPVPVSREDLHAVQ